jgi:hypothetical protein
MSLVELLVAVAIAAVVVPAVFLIIPRSFGNLAATRRLSADAEALAAFDCAFARDFASIVPGAGFDGDSRSCVFWTLRQDGPRSFAPVMVEYSFAPGAAVRRETPPGLFAEATGTNALSAVRIPLHLYPPARRPFSEEFRLSAGIAGYGPAGAPADADSWACATNAPASVAMVIGAPGSGQIRRLHFRRTVP